MNNLFSQKVSDLLVFARKEADRLSSQAICPEHILLGVLHDDSGKAAEFLKHLNINYTSLKETCSYSNCKFERQLKAYESLSKP